MSPAMTSSLSSNFDALEFFILESLLEWIRLGLYRTIDRLENFSSAISSGLGIESELGRTHPSLYWV